jgi:hypothetical protein
VQREEVYEAWAPPNGAWSVWVRPVLFAQMEEPSQGRDEAETNQSWLALDLSWVPRADEHTLLVVNLPGAESVRMGLGSVGRGYRPVPLFNACTGPNEVIPQTAIREALRLGAAYLRSVVLPADAPPAFLLDSSRFVPTRAIRPGVFDNRWQVYPEDFPAAKLLRAQGFTRVVLVQRGQQAPAADLNRVLWPWRESGLLLAVKNLDDAAPPQQLVLSRPARFRRFWERLTNFLGLRRSPAQGFGYMVPEPTHG